MPPEGQVDEYEQWRQQRIRVTEAACALLNAEYEQWRQQRIRVTEAACALLNAMMLYNRDRVELTSAEWLDVLDEIRGKLEGPGATRTQP